MNQPKSVPAPGNKAVRRAPDDMEGRLSRWLSNRVGETVELLGIRRPDDGFSGDTFIVDLAKPIARRGSRLVVRLDVRENVMIPLRDFSYLHRVQAILSAQDGIPVPKVLFIESDNEILGTPFFVSEFVDGRAPGDSKPYTLTGWVPESSPEQLQTMVFSGMEAMARLHALDWQRCGLGFLRRGGPAESELALDLQYYIDCCDWAYGGRWDLVSDVAHWLKKHWPQSERLAFSWGDARLGNMLWRDHRPVAILDWDWAAIADPERDLGYWLLNHRYFAEILPGLPIEWPTREETIGHYERCSGLPVEHITFYETFGCFRQLALMIRVSKLMLEAGTAPTANFVENNPVVTMMRELIAS